MLPRAAWFTASIALAGLTILAAVSHWSISLPAVPPELNLAFAPSPLATPVLVVLALVWIAVAFWTRGRGTNGEAALIAMFALAMAGVLLAQSVAAFLLCWEGMALVSTLLVASHHDRRNVRRATFAYALMSQIGSLCIVIAFALLAMHAGSVAFGGIAAAAATLPKTLRLAILILCLLGFGSKAGILPLHFWLPRAHPAAPANASAMLSGVMLAVAVYGMSLAMLSFAAPVPASFALVVLAIGAATAVAGGLYAAFDSDLKRLLAYSSIENMGVVFAVLGLASLAARLNEPGIAALSVLALLFYVASHAIFKSLLFMTAGTISAATGTTDLERLGGLARALPFAASIACIGCATAAALPPTIGFSAEWLVLKAFIDAVFGGPMFLRASAAVALVAIIGGAGLSAIAYVRFFGFSFLGASRSTHDTVAETFDSSSVGLGALALASLGIGVLPWVALTPIAHVVADLGYALPAAGMMGSLPATLALLPIVGAVYAILRSRQSARRVSTWTCGTSVGMRSQYTPTAFSNPIVMIFKSLVRPDRQTLVEASTSAWFPRGIRYVVSVRYVIDEVARSVAAFVQLAALRFRVVQAGLLRVYLAYAVLALVAVLIASR